MNMNWIQAKRLREERTQLLANARSILKTADDEKRELTSDETAKFDEMIAQAETKKSSLDRYDRYVQSVGAGDEKREATPGRDSIDPDDKAVIETRERTAFSSYCRGRSTAEDTQFLQYGTEYRAALTNAGIGGVPGTRDFSKIVIDKQKLFVGVREAGCYVLKSANGTQFTIIIGDDTANEANQKAENADETGTTEPTLGNVQLSAYTYSSEVILVPVSLVEDAEFDLDSYLQDKVAERIGKKTNKVFTVGTGTGEPKGFAVAAVVGVTTASPTALTYEELLDAKFSVNRAYRSTKNPSVGWQMADTTLAAIMKLKDGNGAYLITALMAEPDKLLDYPYTINDHMAAIAATNVVAAFGDWSKYWVRDVGVVHLQVARELYMQKRQVGYYAWSRHDGNLTDTTAIKTLKMHA